MVLLVHHQQQNLEVRFGWPRRHVEQKTIIPFFGTPKDNFKACERTLHAGTVVMLENGISGLRRRAWIIGLLWNSGDCTECMILLNSNYNDGVDYAFGVVIRNVDSEPIGGGFYMHAYHHRNREGHKYLATTGINIRSKYDRRRMQHLFLPDMGHAFDFPEIGLPSEELERLPSVMALQKFNDDDANQPCKVGGTRTHVVV